MRYSTKALGPMLKKCQSRGKNFSVTDMLQIVICSPYKMTTTNWFRRDRRGLAWHPDIFTWNSTVILTETMTFMYHNITYHCCCLRCKSWLDALKITPSINVFPDTMYNLRCMPSLVCETCVPLPSANLSVYYVVHLIYGSSQRHHTTQMCDGLQLFEFCCASE